MDRERKKHFLALADFEKAELMAWIERARALKQAGPGNQLAGKTVCLLFEKASTRTRISFETAVHGLCGQCIFMSAMDSELGRG